MTGGILENSLNKNYIMLYIRFISTEFQLSWCIIDNNKTCRSLKGWASITRSWTSASGHSTGSKMKTRIPTWENLPDASRKPSSQNNFSEQNSVDPDPVSPSEPLKNNDQLNSNMNHQSNIPHIFNQHISFFGLRLTKY